MQRRKFSREFKLEAVRLVRERGVAVAQAARDLDVHENVLRKWVRELSADPVQAFPGNGQMKPEQLEIERLRREVAKLKAERDILKNRRRLSPPVRGRNGSCYGAVGRVAADGILNNELYVGVRVWNHRQAVKDPRTGRTVRRPNPESEWVRAEVPGLRIVSDDMWQSVKHRQSALGEQYKPMIDGVHAAQASRMHRARRPVTLLSGLVECSRYGGNVGLAVNGRFGCINYHRRHTCENNRTIGRDALEKRALEGLRERLVSPEKVQAAVVAYADYINRENQEQRAHIEADRRALDKIERAIAGIMTAIEDGLYQPTMKARITELERQKAEIAARMASVPHVVPAVHPGIAAIYRRELERFTQTLEDPQTRLDASDAIRSLIHRIVLHPGEKRGEIHATLHGALMGILDFAKETPRPAAVVTTKVAQGSLA